METKYLNPKELKPYKLNAKLHPPEQIEKIIRSIELTGFDQPIVVNKEGNDLVIIKGHGRLEASMQMGLKEVPVIVLEVAKDIADKARLIDNKSAESEYDLEILLQELQKFDEDELPFTGYDESELQDLLVQLESEMGFDEEDRNNGNTKEIEPDEFEFNCKCPKCGFEFNND